MKTCKRCGQTYSDVFFYQNKNIFGSYGFRKSYKELVCIGCQLDERTTKKRTNRPREKARRTLRHHAGWRAGRSKPRKSSLEKLSKLLKELT